MVCVSVSVSYVRSATEGADSAPVSGAGTPSEEKVGQVGMGEFLEVFSFNVFAYSNCNFMCRLVTTKVTQGAKTFGSFLYSAVNKAGSKIKESVKDNVSDLLHTHIVLNIKTRDGVVCFCAQNILGEFSKEQEAFIKNQQGGADAAVAPWIGHQNEEKVKEEILGLSAVSDSSLN